AANALVETGDDAHARMLPRDQRLAEIGLDRNDFARAILYDEPAVNAVAGTDVEHARTDRHDVQRAQERRAEKASERVHLLRRRVMPEGVAQQFERGEEAEGHVGADYRIRFSWSGLRARC